MASKRPPARSAESPHTYAGHTAAGSALTELVLETFRLYGALIAAGDRMTGPVGLTAARWQVLSSVAQAPHPGPVAHVAREMGLTRQSVQRIADQLAGDGLLAFEANPHHKRAPLVIVTPKGRQAFDRITAIQVPWANALGRGLSTGAVRGATAVLRRFRTQLDGPA